MFWLDSSFGSPPPSTDSNPGFFHLVMLLSISYSLQVCCGRNRVSWTRRNCSQLPWPQNDTSICPYIHWGELSHMAPHRCKGAGKYDSAVCLGRDLVATWPACDTKANPILIWHTARTAHWLSSAQTYLKSGPAGSWDFVYLDRWGKQERRDFSHWFSEPWMLLSVSKWMKRNPSLFRCQKHLPVLPLP